MFRLVLRPGEQRGVMIRVLGVPCAMLHGAADQPTVASGNEGALTELAWAARPRSGCSGQDPSTDHDSVRPKSHRRNDPCETFFGMHFLPKLALERVLHSPLHDQCIATYIAFPLRDAEIWIRLSLRSSSLTGSRWRSVLQGEKSPTFDTPVMRGTS